MLSLALEPSARSLIAIVVCALAMGVVYDRVEHGARQRIALGLLAGVACLAAFAVPGAGAGAITAGGIAIVLMTGFHAGVLAAGLAVLLPLAASVEAGAIAGVAAGMALVGAGVLGAGARALLSHREPAAGRGAVLLVAAAGGALLALPPAAASSWTVDGYAVPAAWLCFCAAAFGLLVDSERTRAGASRDERQQAALLKETRQVNAEILATQLRHLWQLHDRYGVQFAFLVVSLDDAPAMRRALSPAAWQELRGQIARHIRETVRDCDICSPISAGRTGILLPYIGRAAMTRVAERIRDRIAEADFRFDQPISVSVGMAHVDEVNGPDDLRVIADDALVVARSATPRGAVGPSRPDDGEPAPLIRTFPGLILSPAPPLSAEEALAELHRSETHAVLPSDREAA